MARIVILSAQGIVFFLNGEKKRLPEARHEALKAAGTSTP